MAKKKDQATLVLPEEQTPAEAAQPAETAGLADQLAAQVSEPVQPAGAVPLVESPKPNLLVRFFSAESASGRFLRGLLRTVALVVGVFALGLLAGYLLLYRPASQALQKSQAELQAVVTTLTDTSQQLDSSRADLLVTQSHLQDIEANLARSEINILVLQVQNDVVRARLAVINKNGPEALSEVKIARRNLDLLLPKVRNLDAKLADLLDEQMTSTEQSLVSDYLKADPDLQKLNDSLETLQVLLVK
jgi:septal ring factor EnvC (AmiA/AmiB activator)